MLKRVIIEGCDGVGKSTLQKKIEDHLNGNTFTAHWTAPPKGMPLYAKMSYMNKVHEHGIEQADLLKNHIIWDRFHLSDLVYLPIYSNGINYHSWRIDQILAQMQFIVIYVKADPKTIKKRLESRGDWFIDLDDIEKICDRYDHVMSKTNLPVFTYKTDLDNEFDAELQDDWLIEFIDTGGKNNESIF